MNEQADIIMQERRRWSFFGIPWTFTKYTITPKKLIIEEGFFKSVENEILMYRLTDISYSRTLGQKLFRMGTLTVYANDKTNPTLVIKNIKHSREFKEALSQCIEEDRKRMRMRQNELLTFGDRFDGAEPFDADGDGIPDYDDNF